MTSGISPRAGRALVLLGSTGSIGTQALDVVSRYPDLARPVALAASGSRPELLAEQAAAHRVGTVAVADPERAEDVERALAAACSAASVPVPRLVAGEDAVIAVAGSVGEGDVVLNGMTGSVGLRPTLAALASGARLALANKESLIVGGPLVTRAAAPGQLLPVDSEHTAIAQAVAGVSHADIDRLVVTASGGPFRGRGRAELEGVTPAEALAHPTWQMGRVITTNSATLVNKALEVIEASLLFDVPIDRVDVVVHPQSVVHSMAQLVDGSTIAQASPPDMRHAIGWALAHPAKLPGLAAPCDWTRAASWTFEPLDEDVFPAVRIGRAAALAGGVRPAVFNAANEVAVDAFHDGACSFLGIVDTVAEVLARPDVPEVASPDVDDVLAAEAWARTAAHEMLGTTP